MAYYRVCPDCGCNLDPGESCDCRNEKSRRQEATKKMLKENPSTGQYEFRFEGQAYGHIPGFTG